MTTTRMQQRRDSAADWTSNDPTLAQGELGFETDTNRFKIGDGTTAWTSLAYANVGIDGSGNVTGVVGLTTTGPTALGDGVGDTVGFYGATGVVQASGLTTTLTTITHDAPGTPDYALSGDLTNTSAYGFTTEDQLRTVLSVVANLQARVDELEAALDSTTGVGLIA